MSLLILPYVHNTSDHLSRSCLQFCLLMILFSAIIKRPGIFVLSAFVVEPLFPMPVTTRSRARGGLQNNTTFVPPPFPSCSTCSNAIKTTTTATEVDTTSINNISLPELCDQSSSTSSSSEADTCSSSSLDSNFEISKFGNIIT